MAVSASQTLPTRNLLSEKPADVDLSLTIPDLFRRAIELRGDELALQFKPSDAFINLSWNDLAREVTAAIHALRAAGIELGDTVAQVAENRKEWIVLDLACHFAGVVHVPLHTSLAGPQLAALLLQCGATHCFVSSIEYLIRRGLPGDECLSAIQWLHYDSDDEERATRDRIRSTKWLPKIGAGTPIDLPRLQIKCDTVATILYTSGTAGAPKGVELTQRNLASNAQAIAEHYGSAPSETKLNILPLSHIFARTCDLYTWLVRGSVLALAQSRESVLNDLQTISPTTLNGVPYFFERLYRGLQARGTEGTPGALKHLLGGRIRSCCSGGAPLPRSIVDFFARHEIPLVQGYGLTESSPVITMSTREDCQLGTCGKPLPGVELKLTADGEILTRGPHVMRGYHHAEAETAKVISADSWLHTGDLGMLDAEGNLIIVGRKSEMIVLSTGKKVAPSVIENLILRDALFVQAMVVGEGKSALGALVVLQPEQFAQLSATYDPSLSTDNAPHDRRVIAMLLTRIEGQLAGLSGSEQVRHVVVASRPFAAEHGEITAKFSLRRNIIAANFAAQLAQVYSHETASAPPCASKLT